jgi:hypothetical protein
MPTPNIPIVNQGLLYVNNIQMSAGALNADNLTTATLILQPGQCRDSTDTNDIVLSTATTLNPVAANIGKVNGTDVGAIAIDTMYAVYVIADSTQYRTTGTLLSTNFTAPTLPFGYDMFRRVGAIFTAHAAARFVYFHQRGNGPVRDLWYAYNNICLSAGNSTTLVSFNLTGAAGNVANQVPLTASKAYVFAHLVVGAGGIGHAIFSADATVTVANGGAIAANPGTGEVILSSWTSQNVDASLVIPCTPSAGPVLPMQSFYAIDANATSVSVSVQGFQDLL